MSTPLGSSQWMYKTGEEPIAQSLKFNDDESQYLSWTPASAGNRKTWTWSGWVKRGNLGSRQSLLSVYGTADADQTLLGFTSSDAFEYSGYLTQFRTSSQVFRDVSAWYHIVCALDTTQATANDRFKVWVNGEQITSWSTNNALSQNTDYGVGRTAEHLISGGTYSPIDGYLADVYFIDGTALDPTSFGETVDGYWKPKEATGLTYGDNGFHLTFQDDIVAEGFNAVTYRGTGATQSVSGLGFSPDLVWTKERNDVGWHRINDTVRGTSKQLYTNATNAEDTAANNMLSFDGDGFTVGTDTSINGSGDTYVNWCWDAGSGSAASNTDGSITSTVKANTSYGFSIVSYTGNGTAGATIGHGLSSAPDMIICKPRNIADNWNVYHSSNTANPETDVLYLNLTNATSDNNTIWNDTAPTSSVFTIGSNSGINTNGSPFIAYCFHSVSGYSSFGSYTGTGSTGNAVTGLGFKPAFLMIKRTDSTSNWAMYDNTRSTTDPRRKNVWANLSDYEYDNSAYDIDFDADGFTLQTSDSQRNASGGTYIYMAFADTREAAFWKDVSGQGNHWTPNNLDYRDSLPDSPANNFAVLNPLRKRGTVTYSEGNLQSLLGAAANTSAVGSFAVTSGKWYFEARIAATTGNVLSIGVEQSATAEASISAFSSTAVSYYGSNGNKYVSGTASAYGATYTSGDVVGVAFDLDSVTQTIEFFKNGTSQGSINLPLGSDWQPILTNGTGTGTQTFVTNFGQDSTFAGAMAMGSYTDDNGIGNFQYAPPSGFLSLCTSNLTTPTIVDGSQHFNTVLWTSNGGVQSITGVGFQPELWWGKTRSSAGSHYVEDVVRGATNYLLTNSTNAEGTDANYLTSFDADGFSMGTNQYASGTTMVAWNWKAGGTAVSNTDGSITSQVSANTDMGFSIVSYTGTGSNATVGHSLGVAPSMVIVKNRSAADGWLVWHEGLSSGTSYLLLHSTNAQASNSAYFNGSPTSSVFNIGTSTNTNGSGNDLIAYCFANSDIIKCGSYTGNGSSDGPFVYTGGRVQWLMIKRTDGAAGWYVEDASRNEYNVVDKYLTADSSDADSTLSLLDFVSNGFKLRTSATGFNASGGSYIYLAIMETPLKNATAR